MGCSGVSCSSRVGAREGAACAGVVRKAAVNLAAVVIHEIHCDRSLKVFEFLLNAFVKRASLATRGLFNPFRVDGIRDACSQGSSCLATLG